MATAPLTSVRGVFVYGSAEETIMALPVDPIMLLSVVNLKLRDYYPTLDALCDDLQEDKAALCSRLEAAGYTYDAVHNRFV